MTRETLLKLNATQRFVVETTRDSYKKGYISHEIALASIGGYAKGLRDAGVITERDRQVLVSYTLI